MSKTDSQDSAALNRSNSGEVPASASVRSPAPAWVDEVLQASREPVPASHVDELRLPDERPASAVRSSSFEPDDWVARAVVGSVRNPQVPAAAAERRAAWAAPQSSQTDPWALSAATGRAPASADRSVATAPRWTDADPADRLAVLPGGGLQGGATVSQHKLVAGLLAIFLGGFGAHKFYLGLHGPGVALLGLNLGTWVVAVVLGTLLFIVGLALTIPLALLVSGLLATFGVVEGLILLTKSDAQFQQEYLIEKKPWL